MPATDGNCTGELADGMTIIERREIVDLLDVPENFRVQGVDFRLLERAVAVRVLPLQRVGGEELVEGPVVAKTRQPPGIVEGCTHMHGDELVRVRERRRCNRG